MQNSINWRYICNDDLFRDSGVTRLLDKTPFFKAVEVDASDTCPPNWKRERRDKNNNNNNNSNNKH